jgi:hypothetical protein
VYPRSSTRVVNENCKNGVLGLMKNPISLALFLLVFFIRGPICEVDLEMGTKISDPHVCSSAASDDDEEDDDE